MKRIFFAIKIIKNQLSSRIENVWLNACLITYIHTDVFKEVENETIMQCFQSMKA